MNLIVPLLVALLVLGFLGLKYFLRQRRFNGLRRLAEKWGWRFHECGHNLVPLPSYFLRSRKGLLQTEDYVGPALVGEKEDDRFFIFQHFRISGANKQNVGYPTPVALVHCPGFNLPRFTIRRASFWSKIASAIAGGEVSFEDAPRFSVRYRVECEDAEAIRHWIGPEVREFLIGQRNLVVQGFANELLLYHPTQMWRPVSFNAARATVLVEESTQLVDLLRKSTDDMRLG